MRATLTGGVLLLAVALSGCQQDGEDAPSGSEPSPTAATEQTCVSVSAEGASYEVTVPEGFTDASQGQVLDRYWTRPPEADEGSFAVVALDAYERDAPDTDVVLRSMNAVTDGNDSGAPGFEAASEEVREDGLTEVGWSAPERVGEGEHEGFVALREVDGVRFTVSVVARSDEDFATLRDEVVASAGEGDCG